MQHLGARIVGGITRRLPCRRRQVGYWLGKALMPSTPFIGAFYGGLVEVHPQDQVSDPAFITGVYEREVMSWALHLLRSEPIPLVVDVGANFGYYPLLLGLKSRGATKSIAFEPDPRNFAWLSRNIALNPSLDITAVQAAVGDCEGGTVPFEVCAEGYGAWSRVRGSEAPPNIESSVEVPCITLDGYLDRSGIESVPLTFIDVEGYESRVIDGMRQGIRDRRYSRVMLEFHAGQFSDPVAELRRITDLFFHAGYVARRFHKLYHERADKCAEYYRTAWNEAFLQPMSFDNLTTWEHFAFEVRPK